MTLASGQAAGRFLRYEDDAPTVAAQTAYGIEAEVRLMLSRTNVGFCYCSLATIHEHTPYFLPDFFVVTVYRLDAMRPMGVLLPAGMHGIVVISRD